MGKVFKALSKANALDRAEPVALDRAEPVALDRAEPVALDRAEPVAIDREEPLVISGERSGGAEEPVRSGPVGPRVARGWDERLVAALGAASGVSEEFRRLRTRILHPPDGTRVARTILVVSTAPREGKTFVCAGLAVSLAQGVEEHVLAVDCDLRQPSLAAMFGLGNNELGLADHLRDGVDLGRLIRKSGLDKLSIIPSGAPPANPAELLGSEKLAAMLREVADRYSDRYILIDSPPLQMAAETAILAGLVDGVVLVVRAGKSRRDDVGQLVETIGPDKIIGVVFNAYRSNLLERRISGAYGGDYYYSSDQPR